MSGVLALGAFDVALDECPAEYARLLEGLFRTEFRDSSGRAPALRLTLRPTDEAGGFADGDELSCSADGGRLRFSSDVVAGVLDGEAPRQLTLRVRTDHPRARYLDHYLRIVLNAVFRRLERVRLHAAALDVGGVVSLFIGDKGAGKTTISLHLGRSGATLLGEDQIMVRRDAGDRFVVAGGDDMMRVTAATEKRFFDTPLPQRPILLAGVEKKQIHAADHLCCALDDERPVVRIFFPHVGDEFACRALSARETLARLSAPLVPIHRFTDADDRRDFLAFLGGLARQAEAWDLTLSRDLDDLARLTEVTS